ncbi:DUF3726 domain-containing protein [Tropicibacter sp. Alg240-R139]|uniref:DUF3726 domain-containing protein n=1 Tax=Tropicibacter sp. Alg240-R139 TaxID=2305991 RepID=UPI0013DFA15E|nr:DUF3726 domain-containing protein [Tropicibacter sp. Alg240-R139]
MSYSLNEVEATAKRATRGAGYAWGLAEDAAKATRWLCAHDIDGVGQLARLLSSESETRLALAAINGVWAAKGVLCPFRTGCLLSDCAHLLNEQPIEMVQVAAPVVLVPFAALAARRLEVVVTVECDGDVAVTDGQILSMPSQWSEIAETVTIQISGTLPASSPRQTRARPNAVDWDTLNRFAHKTYAPATEESRLLGAGAGLSDND